MTHSVFATLAVALLTSFATAQNATVSVLHGIPGLPQPVEVFANGSRLFAFDFGDLRGPLSVPAGVTNLEVRLNGATVLQASPDLQDGANYTVVAHLGEGGGNRLTAYVNDVSRIRGLGEFFATVAFRHVADAPAVDVYGDRVGREVLVYGDVANGGEGEIRGAPAYLLGGPYDIRLTPTGSNQTAFGPDPIGNLRSGNYYGVFAIGVLGQSSFRLVVQTIEPDRRLPSLRTLVRGTPCGGGQIGFGTASVQFDQPFDVVLSGGVPNASGFLLIGFSETRTNFGLRLPFDLGLIGAPGCTLYQSSDGAVSVTLDASGSARVSETIPASLAGFIDRNGVHFQYGFENRGANALGLQFTGYASVVTN